MRTTRWIVLSLLFALGHTAFVPSQQTTPLRYPTHQDALPSPEESAKALTDYMARAHEEKIKALAAVEAKYQDEIQELQERVKQLEGRSPVQKTNNSYEMPGTNKEMTKKVELYIKFISDYLVKAQIQKLQAVAAAEQKMKAHYEAIISSMEPVVEPSVQEQKVEEESFFAKPKEFE